MNQILDLQFIEVWRKVWPASLLCWNATILPRDPSLKRPLWRPAYLQPGPRPRIHCNNPRYSPGVVTSCRVRCQLLHDQPKLPCQVKNDVYVYIYSPKGDIYIFDSCDLTILMKVIPDIYQLRKLRLRNLRWRGP